MKDELPLKLQVFQGILDRHSLQQYLGFPGGRVVKNPPAMLEPQETWVHSVGWEDLLEEGMATHSSVLAWRIPTDRRDSRVTVHGFIKSWT